MSLPFAPVFFFFFFNDTATTEIYTLSLHDALPISGGQPHHGRRAHVRADDRAGQAVLAAPARDQGDRKSTRLNSSHLVISYAVFCLKKKKNTIFDRRPFFQSSHPLLLRRHLDIDYT